MKGKLTVLILVLAVIAICASNNTTGKHISSELNTIRKQESKLDEIKLISITTPVLRGGVCSLTIQGEPDTMYRASYTYYVGSNPYTGIETQASGGDGRATLTWIVQEGTSPGTYRIVITGGGQTLVTSYTVIE